MAKRGGKKPPEPKPEPEPPPPPPPPEEEDDLAMLVGVSKRIAHIAEQKALMQKTVGKQTPQESMKGKMVY